MNMLSGTAQIIMLVISGTVTGFIAVYSLVEAWKRFRLGARGKSLLDLVVNLAHTSMMILYVYYATFVAEHMHLDWRSVIHSVTKVANQEYFIFGFIAALAAAGTNFLVSYARARSAPLEGRTLAKKSH